MRQTDGSDLPRRVDGHLGDRRICGFPDGAAILFLGRRIEPRRSAEAGGDESPGERREALAHVTYFVAMPFVRNEEGELVAGEAQDRQTASAAESLARRMATTAAGAMAFSRTSDPATGEFKDAVVLREFGEVPSLDELLPGG